MVALLLKPLQTDASHQEDLLEKIVFAVLLSFGKEARFHDAVVPKFSQGALPLAGRGRRIYRYFHTL